MSDFGPVIERGDVVTVTYDAYDPDDHGLNGPMYIVSSENAHTGYAVVRETRDGEWLEGPMVALPLSTLGLVHHHEGHACGNPAHSDYDGFIGYHRR